MPALIPLLLGAAPLDRGTTTSAEVMARLCGQLSGARGISSHCIANAASPTLWRGAVAGCEYAHGRVRGYAELELAGAKPHRSRHGCDWLTHYFDSFFFLGQVGPTRTLTEESSRT